MNNVTREEKDRVLKILAIFGFLAVVIFGVWLAIQIVSIMPQAFSSLASIADGIYNYRETTELTVSTEKSVVYAGESFTITWENLSAPGTYAFSYACTEGVALDIRDAQGAIINVACDEAVILGSDVTHVDVLISSERQRFSDINYSISFTPKNGSKELVSENMITIVNASIPESDTVASDDSDSLDDTVTDDMEDDEEDTTGAEPEVAGETTTNTNSTGGVEYVETVTYETPVSDPNGMTDLAVRLIAVGELDGDGDFRQRSNIDSEGRGAFQFEVKNVGTKTSDEWDFEATLTSGTKFKSDVQMPLKPQERAVFTLGYGNVGDDGISMIGVRIRGGADTNATNNEFTWAVSVTD